MRSYARVLTGVLAMTGLVAGSVALAGTAPAHAEASCNGEPVTRVITEDEDDQVNYGTDGDDVVLLKGSAWHVFYAKGGDDTVCIRGYGSEVFGGSGDDRISGEQADNDVRIHGDAGDDTIIGSNTNRDYAYDSLYGGAGSDIIEGRDGSDEIYPDQADLVDEDEVSHDAADRVHGGRGGDVVTVSVLPTGKTSGGDELIGGPGGDALAIHGVRTRLDVENQTARAASGGPVDRFSGFQTFSTDASADIEGGPGRNNFFIGGADSELDAKGGDDFITIDGKNASVRAGSGDDDVYYHASGKKNQVRLGHGDDTMLMLGSRGVEIEGGPGDDVFDILTHGELGEGEGEYDHLFPFKARIRGESGSDTLTWDCKSTVNVAEYRLACTHKRAKVKFSGMQVYKASRNLDWKDEFRGGRRRDVYYGGDKDDIMYGRGGGDKLIGGKGHDLADGGPGKDSCRAEQQRSC